MPSANTVAQKPAGNFNPLSSFEHAEPAEFLAVLDWFCAAIEEITTDTVASEPMMINRALVELTNRIEPSRGGI